MNIQTKLFSALLGTALILSGGMYLLMQWSFDQGMLKYVSQRELQRQTHLIDNLKAYYQQSNNWEQIKAKPRVWQYILQSSDQGELIDPTTIASMKQSARSRDQRPRFEGGRPRFVGPPGFEGGPPRFQGGPPGSQDAPPGFEGGPPRFQDGPPGSQDISSRPKDAPRLRSQPGAERLGRPQRPPLSGPVLLDVDKAVVIGRYEEGFELVPVELQDSIIAWLAFPPREELIDSLDLAFISEQNKAFMLISLLLLISCSAISFPLAKHFIQPIRSLASATSALRKGRYDVKLDTQRRDELGRLAKNFNELGLTLADNEAARRRWIGDISHELRTPLAIAKGELEALLDGVRPLTLNNLRSIQQEIEHLQALMEDLHELTRADLGALRYVKENVDVIELTRKAIERHQSSFEARDVSVSLVHSEPLLECLGDATRIQQVLANLFKNVCKYAEVNAGLSIEITQEASDAIILIDDSGPGVESDELAKLFDHLYRTESSRNRKTGGSGIGLAICQKIVLAHNGQIEALHSPMGGLRIKITLPLA